MVSRCLLKGLILLLLSCSIHGQSQQPPQSKFLPNLFSTIQATLDGFNRFSYIPRPIVPFSPTGVYHPGDVNFAYPPPFVQPILPQRPVVQFTGITRPRQNIPLPTSPPMRDEIKVQLPPQRIANSNGEISSQKHSAPPPPMLPPSRDNRPSYEMKFIQPPSVPPPEESKKEESVDKFHKPVRIDSVLDIRQPVRTDSALNNRQPVRTDSALNNIRQPVRTDSALNNIRQPIRTDSASDNIRQTINIDSALDNIRQPVRTESAVDNIRQPVPSLSVAPSNSDNFLMGNITPHSSYSTETVIANSNRNRINSRPPAKPSRISPQINKERVPFDNFKPIAPHARPFSRRKPPPPQVAETQTSHPGVPNDVSSASSQEGNSTPFPESDPEIAEDTRQIPSASDRHSIYVKPSDELVEPELSNEEVTHEISNEASPPSHSPKEDSTNFDTAFSSVPEIDGNLPTEPVTRLPLSLNEEHLPTITPNAKYSMPLNETRNFDEMSSLKSWVLGDNKVLAGTPEEILTLKLADAINNFGFGLYRNMQETNNLFFSPLSLSAALAIVLEGASNMTALQMMNGLHLTESNIRPDEVKFGFKRLMKSLKSKRSDYQFENANLLLLQNKFVFKGEFSNTVYKHYKPLLGSVDFVTDGINIKRSVNDWVKRKTHGKIEEFLTEQLPPETVFAVLNAVYFRGRWIQPFDTSLTTTTMFYNYGKDPVEVTMMKQIGYFPLGYSFTLNAHIIELAYEGEETSMVILVPKEHDGIYKLKDQLSYQQLHAILSEVDIQLVKLSLPRFSLRSRYDMEDVLKEMGMRDVFIPGKANFGRMTNATGLYVSKLSHEGVIDVDEKGTEAAANTGVFVVPLSTPHTVIVDRPFLFFIRNRNNGVILFIGQFDAFDD